MANDECLTADGAFLDDVEGAHVRAAALSRAAGLAESARGRPGETFGGAFEKCVIDEVVALLKKGGFMVRVGPHGANPTERSAVTVVWPKNGGEQQQGAGKREQGAGTTK